MIDSDIIHEFMRQVSLPNDQRFQLQRLLDKADRVAINELERIIGDYTSGLLAFQVQRQARRNAHASGR